MSNDTDNSHASWYKSMHLMAEQDEAFKDRFASYSGGWEGIMDFLLSLPENERFSFLERNQRYFEGLNGLGSIIPRAIRRGLVEGLEGEFYRRALFFELGTAFDSSPSATRKHPEYQQLVAMGSPIVPFILREIKDDQTTWFEILEDMMRGQCPAISEGDRNYVEKLKNIWLEWGQSQGFI